MWDALPGSNRLGDPTNAFEPDTALNTGTAAQAQGVDLRIQLVAATSALQTSGVAELPAHDMLLSAMGGRS